MKYLVDTNVLLEVALHRSRWRDATHFLSTTPTAQLAVADFSLNSMGFYLWKTPESFNKIVADVLKWHVAIIRLEPAELFRVTQLGEHHRLSFDDAFIYTLAELRNLAIVSFDADFDGTPRGRTIPTAPA